MTRGGWDALPDDDVDFLGAVVGNCSEPIVRYVFSFEQMKV